MRHYSLIPPYSEQQPATVLNEDGGSDGRSEGAGSRRHLDRRGRRQKGKKWRHQETNRPRQKPKNIEWKEGKLDGFLEFLISDIGTLAILRKSGNVNSAFSPAGREELTGLL